MKTLNQHNIETIEIADKIKKYYKSNKTNKLRFYHSSTNSTRKQVSKDYCWINISHLDQVIEINTKKKYIVVEPNIPMDKLVSITLQYGLIPPVVMEFPGITVGGAINGTALESSSFKYGQFNDICREYEIILGNGNIIYSANNKNKDIFYGISGTYGTLGLLTLIKISLISASKFVRLKYYPIKKHSEILNTLQKFIDENKIDYLETIVFGKENSVVITGKLTNDNNLPIKTYSKAYDKWFYESAKEKSYKSGSTEELVPITDYLFRYNRGAFWMGEYALSLFHIPKLRISKFILNPFFNTRRMYKALHKLNMGQKYFIQDFYCPIEKTLQFLEFTESKINIFPIWLCPIKPSSSLQKLSTGYINSKMLIDIGIWGKSKRYLNDPLKANKLFEEYAIKTGARKMLYADTYYQEEDFWKVYDRKWYLNLRKKYNAEKIFPEIWQKIHSK